MDMGKVSIKMSFVKCWCFLIFTSIWAFSTAISATLNISLSSFRGMQPGPGSTVSGTDVLVYRSFLLKMYGLLAGRRGF